MKKLYIILLVLPLIGFGQGWETTFGGDGGDGGYSVQQTNDGGYIITGSTESFGNGSRDVYLIKTDENGNEQWYQTFGGTETDVGHSVQQTNDGGYIITGSTESFGNGGEDIYLIKTDENGNEQWSQIFGDTNRDFGNSVQQTTDGGYIITGGTKSFGNGSMDVYLIKTDENGNEQWYQTFGGTETDVGHSVQQTNDGGYIIVGGRENNNFVNDFWNDVDVYLIKTDENGNELWSQIFGGTNRDFGNSVQQTTDGGYIIIGQTESFGGGIGDWKGYLIKTNENGMEQWFQTYGYSYESKEIYFGQQTSDGGFIMTGFQGLGMVVCLIKTDENGNEQWSQTFGVTSFSSLENNQDWGSSVQQTNDGGYIITGSTKSFGNGSTDVYLIKTDSEGNVETTSTIEPLTPKSNRELIKTTNILGQENTTIKNQPMIEIYDDGSVEKKYIIE